MSKADPRILRQEGKSQLTRMSGSLDQVLLGSKISHRVDGISEDTGSLVQEWFGDMDCVASRERDMSQE